MSAIARSRTAVAAEVLFLQKQLAYYQEHHIRPRRLTDVARLSMVLWSGLFDWKEALTVVTPATFVRWHRKSFKLYWRWKSRVPGRRAIDIAPLRQIDDDRLFNQLPVWAPDENVRRTILVENPARLYGF